MKGKVLRILKDKGFGFIGVAGGGPDMFFHRTALKNVKFDDLHVGQEVEFEVGEGEKGPRAEDVYA